MNLLVFVVAAANLGIGVLNYRLGHTDFAVFHTLLGLIAAASLLLFLGGGDRP
jgi:hypothetical protein